MPRFREQKKYYLELCAQDGWRTALEKAVAGIAEARAAVNPLLALLPRPEFRWQAVYGLELCLAHMAEKDMESARIFMRRLMWSLNEESGNLGWGIPEAMGAILGASPALAKEYARIFLSYGYETGKQDNFLDHAPLRRGVYWGVGRLAQGNAAAARAALPHLAVALKDADFLIRGMAGWALLQLALHSPRPGQGEPGRQDWQNALARLEEEPRAPDAKASGTTAVELFNGRDIIVMSLGEILEQAAAAIRKAL